MKLHPQTSIRGTSQSVSDFWEWAYSDILSNRNRAIFAEFLVGSALDAIDDVRAEWDSVDLHYRGKGIEVKSSGYVQSWFQSKRSLIKFDIEEKRFWDTTTNIYSADRQRNADCYVFCLFNQTDRALAHESIPDTRHWEFYVLSTEFLNQTLGKRKSISLKLVQSHCQPVRYEELKQRIDDVLFETGNPI